MTTQFEDEFLELVAEMFAEFIVEPNATFIQMPDHTVSNQNQPWIVTQPLSSQFSVRILFDRIDRDNHQLLKYRYETETQDGKIKGYMPDTGFKPTLKDVVHWNDQELVITSVDSITPIGATLLYVLEFGS